MNNTVNNAGLLAATASALVAPGTDVQGRFRQAQGVRHRLMKRANKPMQNRRRFAAAFVAMMRALE
jgi:hypothetical protein